MPFHRFTILTLIVTCGLASGAANADDAVRFGRDILPILSENCFACHGPDANKREADLRLDVEEDAKSELNGTFVIKPSEPDESALVERIRADIPDERMPPPESNKKLTPRQIELLTRWIEQGAPWGEHWAFEPIERPALPDIGIVVRSLRERNANLPSEPSTFTSWPRNAIDHFILALMLPEALTPSPLAAKETLIRRVTLDLTGLPPTPEDVDAFLSDTSPDAYEKLVERLLASPAYGERMAWDWLDAARYADSNGYQGDAERTMWPWRDWVVDAFNRNLPYDQFTIWQLAGDLLPNATFEQQLATGFCRNHMINGEGGRIAEENRVDYVMDMSETMGTVWLALTVGCCRCHDHKFDPLSQRDYYSMFAFFNQTPVDGGGGNPQTPPVLAVTSQEQQRRLDELAEAIVQRSKEIDTTELTLFPREEGKSAAESDKAAGLPDNVKAALSRPAGQRDRNQLTELEKQFENEQADYVNQLRALRTAIDERDSINKSLPRVMVMQDMPNPRKSFLLDRGLYNKPTDEVSAALPTKLGTLPTDESANRLSLARWLMAHDNPLTARVAANRLWQQFFGAGLVKTPEDFGVQGQFPSHPELLDWLASEFRDSGWDVKHLVRLIVTSSTYRQSSQVTDVEIDPENRLLSRAPRYRLPSWMLRDQALAASGLLAPKLGGPPVKPYQPANVWEEATFGKKNYEQDHGQNLYRRSVYTFWRRIIAPTAFFDSASRQTCMVNQTRTNSPLHALATLNDMTYVEAARAMAERVLNTAEPQAESRIDLAYRFVLARSPNKRERQVLLASLARVREQFAGDPDSARKLLAVGESPRDQGLDPIEHASYTAVCLAILNLDEALTKE